ncbi:zf-TFIIB domain-containing protein [Pseudarthrobacter sp. NPDC058329]|uniref:TFIIB-type zinc ribbon-containing protein n=1 Tax=Pseudarthrobacter sp. NPDC058329 TaxID=3346448 RepID=UPI0036D9838B
MKCPVDSVELMMTERSGVEIDYCPQCRGVWLDRGELDKILDRAADMSGPAPARPSTPAPGMAPPPLYPNFEPRRDQRGYDERRYGKQGYDRDNDRRRHKKKEGWLGDLFDF